MADGNRRLVLICRRCTQAQKDNLDDVTDYIRDNEQDIIARLGPLPVDPVPANEQVMEARYDSWRALFQLILTAYSMLCNEGEKVKTPPQTSVETIRITFDASFNWCCINSVITSHFSNFSAPTLYQRARLMNSNLAVIDPRRPPGRAGFLSFASMAVLNAQAAAAAAAEDTARIEALRQGRLRRAAAAEEEVIVIDE